MTATRRMRWLLPAGAVAAILLVGVPLLIRAAGGVGLPSRTPGQLLTDLRTSHVDGLSGTLVERANLFTDVPDVVDGDGDGSDPDASADFSSLITGSHTLRLWYSDPTHVRLTLLGALGESDVIRNDDDLWVWSSTANTATHTSLHEAAGTTPPTATPSTAPPSTAPPSTAPPSTAPPSATPSDLVSALTGAIPLSPLAAAGGLIHLLDHTVLAGSTAVTTTDDGVVADRSAYQLIITPRGDGSLISQIRVAIDGQWHVPLRVQVYAAGDAKPALEVGFTQVSFNRPDAAEFQFNPPPGISITQDVDGSDDPTDPAGATTTDSTVIGTGWTSVLATRPSATTPIAIAPGVSGPPTKNPSMLAALIAGMPRVHGAWGDGRLLSTRLFTALVTDDGRILVGAVGPAALLRAAAAPSAALAPRPGMPAPHK